MNIKNKKIVFGAVGVGPFLIENSTFTITSLPAPDKNLTPHLMAEDDLLTE